MERDSLIRVCVLCELLVTTLDELDDDGAYGSPQLLDELRALAGRASEALGQLGELGLE